MQAKGNVAVIFGGCSSEYSVSLQSAYAVLKHIDHTKNQPIPVGITAGGEWYRFYGDIEEIAADTWHSSDDCTPALISPNRRGGGLMEFEDGVVRTTPLAAALPMLHGKNGEDGTVQGLLELAGIPLIGCDTCCSALCMDKERANTIVAALGIAVPKSVVISKETERETIGAAVADFAYPLFVKPVRAGSSFGISCVDHSADLLAAVENALRFDSRVIIEEAVDGVEVGCAVLGNESLKTGLVDEIELSKGFFDYTEKYTLQSSRIHVPARIRDDQAWAITKVALEIYRALGCRGFARVDLFLTVDGKILFNEVNTIPGFTAHSRYPHMLQAAGMSFEEIVAQLMELAVAS